MKTIANKTAVRLFQGFEVYVLSNENVELAIVPCLGSKIISLKNLQTAREWLWHPDGGLKLFRNYANDDFSKSPLVGIDECLPTIAPCSWRGRELPDHGEVWAAACDLNAEAWEYGVLKTAVRLKLSPFTFERTIELNENEILISYQLTNHSAKEEHFLWALHPLLRLQPGDQLELPQSTRHLLNGASWIDDVDSAIPEGQCAKIFAAFATEGAAAICNQETGDRLEFEWDIAENDTLGLWLTRGGWHGYHHFAIEPTNGHADALTAAVKQEHCGVIAPSSSVNWRICLRVSP